jgi:hypothetical protein
MNIYISNLKDKYLMVYEDGKWLLKNKKEINRLYEEKELMLEEWIEENKDPEMDKFFSRYLDLKKVQTFFFENFLFFFGDHSLPEILFSIQRLTF